MNTRYFLMLLALVFFLSFALILACGDDDDDSDDGNESGDCEDLISMIYDGCEYAVESYTAMEAYDLCTEDEGPWGCIFECANDDDVEDCSSFADCLDFVCDVSTGGGSGGGNGGGGGGDWYDEDKSAYENCVAFYEMYFDCFDVPVDESTIEAACSVYDGWEDDYEDDDCMMDALEDFWRCLGDLNCADFSDFQAFGSEVTQCATEYANAIMDCDGGEEDLCTEAMTYIYETCGFVIRNDIGEQVSLEDAIMYCEWGEWFYECVADCYFYEYSCDGIADCVEDYCAYY